MQRTKGGESLPLDFIGVSACLIFRQYFDSPLSLAVYSRLPNTGNGSAVTGTCNIQIAMCGVKDSHEGTTTRKGRKHRGERERVLTQVRDCFVFFRFFIQAVRENAERSICEFVV